MNAIRSLRIQKLKVKHTGFDTFQLISVIIITLALDGFFVLYSHKTELERIKLIQEIVAAFLPMTCSISIAWLLKPDEEISNLFGLLAVKSKKQMIAGTLLTSWFYVVAFLMIQTLSVVIIGACNRDTIVDLLLAFAGTSVFSMFFSMFHLFLHLRFGIGTSIFFGIFECMQAIIYGNITLAKGFRYIPSAWVPEWQKSVINHTIADQKQVFSVCLFMLIGLLIVFIFWFEKWEGKKND